MKDSARGLFHLGASTKIMIPRTIDHNPHYTNVRCIAPQIPLGKQESPYLAGSRFPDRSEYRGIDRLGGMLALRYCLIF